MLSLKRMLQSEADTTGLGSAQTGPWGCGRWRVWPRGHLKVWGLSWRSGAPPEGGIWPSGQLLLRRLPRYPRRCSGDDGTTARHPSASAHRGPLSFRALRGGQRGSGGEKRRKSRKIAEYRQWEAWGWGRQGRMRRRRESATFVLHHTCASRSGFWCQRVTRCADSPGAVREATWREQHVRSPVFLSRLC